MLAELTLTVEKQFSQPLVLCSFVVKARSPVGQPALRPTDERPYGSRIVATSPRRGGSPAGGGDQQGFLSSL